MENHVDDFIPLSLEDIKATSFSILVKNKAIGNLSYMGIADFFTGSLETTKAKYAELNQGNNGDHAFYIVSTKLAEQFSGSIDKMKVSEQDIADIINKTQTVLNIDCPPLLTSEEIIAAKKEEELAWAKNNGLFNKLDSKLSAFIPANIEEEEFTIISKNKNNDDFKSLSLTSPLSGSLKTAQEFLATFNQLNNDNSGVREFFIVKSNFADQIPKLSDDNIEEIVNQTQKIIGSSSVLKRGNSSKNSKIPNPNVQEILTTEGLAEENVEAENKIETPVVAPTPEELSNNYVPISEQLLTFSRKEHEALSRSPTMPIGKKLLFTTVALVGVGLTSMVLAPIAMPAAFVIGAIAILKPSLFKKSNKQDKEVMLWRKQQDILKEAAVSSLGEMSKQDIARYKQDPAIYKIAFSPEIVEKYLELAKIAKIPPSLGSNIKDMRSEFDSEKSHVFERKSVNKKP